MIHWIIVESKYVSPVHRHSHPRNSNNLGKSVPACFFSLQTKYPSMYEKIFLVEIQIYKTPLAEFKFLESQFKSVDPNLR